LFNLKRIQDGFIFEKESIEGERIPITRFKIAHHLPLSTIINFPGKMPAFISLSGTAICGGNDFSRTRLEEGRLSTGKPED